MAQELDRPIQSANDDRLGRGPFVEQLRRALVDEGTGRSTGLVVALLGAWGSGKSSILNLLEADLNTHYDNAIVLRFDPWLIANRDSLVQQFLSDLVSLLSKDAGRSEKSAQKAGELLSTYDDLINVGIEATGLLPIPGLGIGLKFGKGLLKKKDKTLHQLKSDVNDKIAQITAPIVVLIDEVDRLDDGEVLELMRLVKAVADFPNVSYLIAYDVDRVVEALGSSAKSAEDVAKRGRSYLEKIVQHQVFLPALFETELTAMLRREISAIVGDVDFPDSPYSDEHYAKIENSIVPKLISTPRDVKRCIGNFRALHLMVGEEVNWIDLLGYATLIAKTPSLTERIKQDPIFFSSDFARGGSSFLRYGVNAPDTIEQLKEVLGDDFERKRPETKLLKTLFPRFQGQDRISEDHTRIEHYRALTFLLRQGTPPGALPLSLVRGFFDQTPDQLVTTFSAAVLTGQFDDLNYILSYHYQAFNGCDHVKFWTALADWCRKPDTSIPTEHDSRVGYLELIESSFASALVKSPELAGRVFEIVDATAGAGAVEFAAQVLRNQMWAHGLFDKESRLSYAPIGDVNSWRDACLRWGTIWKNQHLNTDWFFGNWKESPVWFLHNIHLWDPPCVKRLLELVEDEPAFEAFVMMVFGRHYRVDRDGVDKLIGWENFQNLFRRMRDKHAERAWSVDVEDAYQKAGELFEEVLDKERTARESIRQLMEESNV